MPACSMRHNITVVLVNKIWLMQSWTNGNPLYKSLVLCFINNHICITISWWTPDTLRYASLCSNNHEFLGLWIYEKSYMARQYGVQVRLGFAYCKYHGYSNAIVKLSLICSPGREGNRFAFNLFSYAYDFTLQIQWYGDQSYMCSYVTYQDNVEYR